MSPGPGHARGPNRTTYKVWEGILARCTNPKASGFDRYGGRGITVCDRWRSSFEAFLADMGARPSRAHQIDREKNDGPYAPENCRWATSAEQARNRSSNVLLTIDGETMCLLDWAIRIGMPRNTLRNRLLRGWSPERAVRTPMGALARGADNAATKIDGETANEIRKLREIGVTIREVAAWASVSPTTIKNVMSRFDARPVAA